MKTRRYKRVNKRSRRNLKGGFLNFFSKKPIASSSDCDVNNLSTISKDMGDGQDPVNKMHTNYQKCCPKDSFGKYNSSPYCKQLKMNFDTQVQYKRDITGYYGDETDVSKIKETMQSPVAPSKPWYKIWGGKTKRHKRRSKK
jgi:hypothetical protein